MEHFLFERTESPDVLVDAVYAVRTEANEKRAFALFDEIVKFDKELKKDMVARFGSTRFLQEVPAWQALIGGSIESSPTIAPELKAEIEEKIAAFVAELRNRFLS